MFHSFPPGKIARHCRRSIQSGRDDLLSRRWLLGLLRSSRQTLSQGLERGDIIGV